MGYKERSREKFNAKWRQYTCTQCGNEYEVFTVSPVSPELRICYLCQKQHVTLKTYANALGAVIQLEAKKNG
jgi:hypothetical protein